MTTQTNKEIIQRFFDERWNHGNLDVYDELYGPNMDIEGSKAWARDMYKAIGNIHFQIVDILAEGDKIAICWRSEGIHLGELMGIPPTGKSITIQGMAWLRLADGKIVYDDGVWDNLEILKQLDVALPAGV